MPVKFQTRWLAGVIHRIGRSTFALSLLSGCLSTLVVAEAQSQPDVTRIDVTLSNFRFDPNEIEIVHGRKYALQFINAADGGHDFVARKFFAAAEMTSDQRHEVERGEVELKGHQQKIVVFTAPEPGIYEFHCGHFMHETFGMKGRIQVQ
jgi:uncharacterized cupredoxin-like copper-binding protein